MSALATKADIERLLRRINQLAEMVSGKVPKDGWLSLKEFGSKINVRSQSSLHKIVGKHPEIFVLGETMEYRGRTKYVLWEPCAAAYTKQMQAAKQGRWPKKQAA